MEQTAMMRKALQDKLKKNQHGYKKALAMPAFPPAAPQLTNTVVQEFHFHTDKNGRTHSMETRSETKDFVQTLRSNSQTHQVHVCPGFIWQPLLACRFLMQPPVIQFQLDARPSASSQTRCHALSVGSTWFPPQQNRPFSRRWSRKLKILTHRD